MCAQLHFFAAAMAVVWLASGPTSAAEFATSGATVTVHGDAPIMGDLPDLSQQANASPFSIGVNYHLGGLSSSMTESATAMGTPTSITSILEANGGGGGLGGSMGAVPTGTATVALSASAALSIYETIVTKQEFASESFQPPFPSTHEVSWDFDESPLSPSADGSTNKEYTLTFTPPSPSFGSASRHITQTITWSVGPPPGSSENPFTPKAISATQQDFSEPALCDAAIRYQAPEVDASLRFGFELAGADLNPFTSFRFPDVPAGADNRFKLTLGGSEIMGLAGEAVNLGQYAPGGFSALSLRGDLTPFLPAAAAPDAALPIGGPPPQLTFGLAFAQPGIGSFTLKPVPEPEGWVLGIMALALLLLARRSGFSGDFELARKHINRRRIRDSLRAAATLGLLSAFASVASATTPLEIWVDPDGSSYLYNSTSSPISFDGYRIASETNRLDPVGWKSISDYVAGGQVGDVAAVIAGLGPGALSFGEASPGPGNLAELNLGSVGTLQGGAKFYIGKPFLDRQSPDSTADFSYMPPSVQNSQRGDIGGGVPEPSNWLLATLAAVCVVVMRRRE
ncbi:MAG: hypothetical protein U0836_25055 [Pirellulales bacterium]